jgi:hypothetical protein
MCESPIGAGPEASANVSGPETVANGQPVPKATDADGVVARRLTNASPVPPPKAPP